MDRLDKIISDILPEVLSIRRDIHKHPEIGMEEVHTAELIRKALVDEGVELEPCCGTGTVALMRGKGEGKTLGLRADIDALPIEEDTGSEFASEIKGMMHACGHDVHTAILIGTVMALHRLAPEFKGNIKFLFQPAEENKGGGELMVKAGALKDPDVDTIFGLHVWPKLKLGQIAVLDGPAMASFCSARVTIKGTGGHISSPHKANNPIYVGMDLIGAMQRIKTQRIDPGDNAVFDVATVQAGNGMTNAIPETFFLASTLRCYSEDMARMVEKELIDVLEGYKRAYHVDYELNFKYGYPPVVNDPEAAGLLRKAAGSVEGMEVVTSRPDFSAEDFGYYLREIPGAFAFLGVGDGDTPMLHSPHFLPDERTIPLGIKLFCNAAAEFFGSDFRS